MPDTSAVRRHLDGILAGQPALADRIHRALLIALHQRGHATVDEIHAKARDLAQRQQPETGDDNVQIARALDDVERRLVREITLDKAAEVLTVEDVDDLVQLTRKREEARTLEEIANLSAVSFGLLAEKVRSFCRLPTGGTALPESEAVGVRVALCRQLVSDQLEFIGIARQWLRIRDYDDLCERMIGDDAGSGRIGGKAGGLFLAHRILARVQGDDREAPRVPFAMPESWIVRSDVLERFLEQQGLFELQSHKYKDIEEIRREYPLLVQVLKNATISPEIVGRLRDLLERTGEHPLIVRSSSLLEDRFGAAFAGKYRSIFLPNQGPVDDRLRELLGAITEVYASTLHPDPISYRRRHNLIDYAENMAILIQKVVGQRYGRWFLPTWAGVAFSRNEHRRNARIRPEDGVARIVMGLGTRAVDRVASDFPRMVPLGAPTLRPEVTTQDIVRYSQRGVDAIDLSRNAFVTVPLEELVTHERLPGLDQVVSVHDAGHLHRPVGTMVDADPRDLVVTFDKWTAATPYPAFLRWALSALERAYGHPVDIEFAYDGARFHLLQCRPQSIRKPHPSVRLPHDLPADRVVFSAARDVQAGCVDGIEFVVCVDPLDYDPLPTHEARGGVSRAIARLNQKLAQRRFILMGPGRWGTRDPLMGIRCGYADIDNARMLIEIARARGSFVPEASFGSHFFQDLVESDIQYLALYPDDRECVYDERFLRRGPNVLAAMLPEFAGLADVVRVIDVRAARGGRTLRVDMDEDAQKAAGYLF